MNRKHLQQAFVLFSPGKKLLYAAIIVLVCTFAAQAQPGTVGIGTTTPNQKAILDILSTNKGLLIPRLTTAQREALALTYGATENGMIVFDTGFGNFQYWYNGQWNIIGSGSGGPGSTNTVLNGTVDPTNQGVNGDFYINTATVQIFGPKTGGAWGTGTSLKGTDGLQGIQGATGATGPTGNNGTSVTIKGSVENQAGLAAIVNKAISDGYLDKQTGNLWVWDGATWVNVGEIRGPQGIQGPKGNDGTSVTIKGSVNGPANLPTTNNTLSDGYLVESTGDLWVWTGNSWTNVGKIRGPEGPAGATGAAGPVGPAGTNGTSVNIKGSVANEAGLAAIVTKEISDGYLAEDNGHLWVWTGNSWTDAGEIRGPQGLTGPAGPTGPKGGDGTSVVIKGSVTTEANLATIVTKEISDGYLAEDTGHLWVWTGTSWTDAGEIRGPAGTNGTSVTIKGNVPTNNELPTTGNTLSDGYLTNDGHLWVWTGAGTGLNGAGWTDAGEIRGPQGLQGPQGIPGNTVRNGTVAPDVNTPGVDGDFYINTTLSQIYGPRTAGAWGNPTQLGAGPASATAELFTGAITITSSRGFGKFPKDYVVQAPPEGYTAKQFIQEAITEVIPPTFTAPTVTLTATATPTPSQGNIVELGSPFSVSLLKDFKQNDGGTASQTTYFRDATALGSTDPTTDNIASFTATVKYTVKVTYNAGTGQKPDNQGTPVNNNIPGGTITSNEITFTTGVNRYWGYLESGSNSPTSDEVVAALGGGKELVYSKAKSGFSVSPAATGSKYIYFAYPAELGALGSQVTLDGFGTTFTPHLVDVTNQFGKTQSYRVYVSPEAYTANSGNIVTQ